MTIDNYTGHFKQYTHKSYFAYESNHSISYEFAFTLCK